MGNKNSKNIWDEISKPGEYVFAWRRGDLVKGRYQIMKVIGTSFSS